MSQDSRYQPNLLSFKIVTMPLDETSFWLSPNSMSFCRTARKFSTHLKVIQLSIEGRVEPLVRQTRARDKFLLKEEMPAVDSSTDGRQALTYCECLYHAVQTRHNEIHIAEGTRWIAFE